MTRIIDLKGKRFGSLKVLFLCDYRNKHQRAMWRCKCDCGKEVDVCSNSLLNNNTKSCGCVKINKIKDLHLKHKESHTKLFNVWVSIKQRCFNNKNKSYKNYGGRGITICKEWSKDYIRFRDWALLSGYKEGLTIDRIDNNGNYEPNNCRWVTSKEQQSNTRRTRHIYYNGNKYTMKELAELLGINYFTFAGRISTSKWSIEEAIKGARNGKTKQHKKYCFKSFNRTRRSKERRLYFI